MGTFISLLDSSDQNFTEATNDIELLSMATRTRNSSANRESIIRIILQVAKINKTFPSDVLKTLLIPLKRPNMQPFYEEAIRYQSRRGEVYQSFMKEGVGMLSDVSTFPEHGSFSNSVICVFLEMEKIDKNLSQEIFDSLSTLLTSKESAPYEKNAAAGALVEMAKADGEIAKKALRFLTAILKDERVAFCEKIRISAFFAKLAKKKRGVS